ncbi:hypothetical protein HYZ78_04295 [Candidatus Microgenomates bacterium]|nr:hypothetical protein [Candidatus Microgenomates bacterium]
MIKQVAQKPNKQAPIRNPLEEVLEVVKNAGEQTGAKPMSSEQPQMTQQPEAPLPQPSLLEKKKPTQIRAIENELREIRMQKKQVEQQQKIVEERQVQQEEVVKEEKKSRWQKGLDFVKKRAMHQIEGRQQKAA